LRALAEQYWSLAVDLRSAARTARERLRGYSYAARHARTVLVPAERSVVEETLRNFNAMQIGAFDVLVARRNELAAERRAVQLEAAAHQARLDLDELLAGHWSRSRTELSNKEPSDEHHP
jgi:outer membrane protein TolC